MENSRRGRTGGKRGKSLSLTLTRYWSQLREYSERNPKKALATLLAAAYGFITGVGALAIILYIGRIGEMPFDVDAGQYGIQFFLIGLTICFILSALVFYLGYPGAILSMFVEGNRRLQSLLYPTGRGTAVKQFRKRVLIIFAPLAAAVVAFNLYLWAQLTPSTSWQQTRMGQSAVLFAGVSICLAFCSAVGVYRLRKSLKDAATYCASLISIFIFFGAPALLLYTLALGKDEPLNLIEMLAAQLLILLLNLATHRSLSTTGQLGDCLKAGAGALVLVFFMLGLWQVFPKGVVRMYGIGNVSGVTLNIDRRARGVLDAADVPVQCAPDGERCTARGLKLRLKTRSTFYLSYRTDDGRITRFELPRSAETEIVFTDAGGAVATGPAVSRR